MRRHLVRTAPPGPPRHTVPPVLVVAAAIGLAACADGGPSKDVGPEPDVPVDAADSGDEPDSDVVGERDGDSGTDDGSGGLDPAEQILAIEQTAEIALPGLQAPVQVVRTESDIPHIYASSTHDLYFAAGYVVARDRWFEFEVASRMARGTLTELLGDLALETDMDSRGAGMRYVADRVVANLPAEGRAVFQAYADGVNAWIARLKAGLETPPTELSLVGPLLGVSDPTSIVQDVDVDSVAGLIAFVIYTSSHEYNDLVRENVASQVVEHYGEDVAFRDLRAAGLVEDVWRPVRPVHAVAMVDWEGAGERGSGAKSRRDESVGSGVSGVRLPQHLLRRGAATAERWARRLGTPATGDHGSNAWAVMGSHTRDGEALLAGDGHLSLGVPTLFVQLGLDDMVFGGGSTRHTGLFIPGFPLMGVGTNGDVAWSQTYPRADTMDFYREQLLLGEDGVPVSALFDGEYVPLVRVDETYSVAAALGGAARDEVWPRWTTADGRWLIDIEGDEAPGPEAAGAVQMLGTWIVPGDTDEDGVIAAISMDYTAFDVGDLYSAVAGLSSAADVHAFQAATAGFVGYAQNLVAADTHGSIQATSYTATPCRGYLERTTDGDWAPGAHPNRVLDGTRYGGFTIPIGSDGRPLEGDPDPYRCVIPFDEWPATIDPTAGWVASANQDPAGITLDDDMSNDRYHIGGPWVPGFRARRIGDLLDGFVDAPAEGVRAMATIQGDHVSMVGRLFAEELLRGVRLGAQAALGSADPDERRLAELYASDAAAFDEVAVRIAQWLESGASAESGVETFYHAPSDADRRDAVATMLFNAWFREWFAGVFDDEGAAFVFTPSEWGRTVVTASLQRIVEGRGEGNPLGLASWNEATGESAFFDVLGTAEVESSAEVSLAALGRALVGLRAPQRTSGEGGFGTAEMSAWLWGLRHQVKFESILSGFAAGNPLIDLVADRFAIDTSIHPLAPAFEPGDPRRGLRWFPRSGDLFAVDAATPAFAGRNYHYDAGPVMRMVVALRDGEVWGQNIIPSGQSGIVGSPYFADQTRRWLANDALPLRHSPSQVVAGAVGRETLTP